MSRINTNALAALATTDRLRVEARAAEIQRSGYSLCVLGDPILKQSARRVATAGEIDHGLITALEREMRARDGVGMAAQQVGGIQRICITKAARGKRMWPVVEVFINPRIVARSADSVLHTGEGCLSAPGFRTSVRRSAWVDVEYETVAFEPKRERFTDFAAQVIQHECDHLDGICIVDRVSRQQRRQAERLVRR